MPAVSPSHPARWRRLFAGVVRHTCLLLCVLPALLSPSPARAAAYAVELDAPASLRPLFEKHLQIYVEIGDPELTEARFRFLARRATEEIRSILMTEGFFSPTVRQRIESRDERMAVVLEVEPGEPSRITAIDLAFRGPITEGDAENEARRKTLQRAMPLRTDAIFRNEEWEKAKQSLLQELRSERYPAAQIVESQALVDPDAHSVRVRIVLDSGPPFTFGELAIDGLNVLPASIITGINRIKPGSPYSEQALIDLQNRLQGSNYFRSVFVTTPTDPGSPERVPIRVSVVENLSRRIGIGVGFSTDTGAGVEFRYEDNLTFRPGWRSRSTLKLDQREQSLATELYLVPILGGLQPRLDAQARRTDIQNDTTLATALGARLLRPGFASEWSLSLELRSERKEAAGQLLGETTSLPLNLSWTRRVLDDALAPRKGFVANLQAGGALDETLSDQRFTRLYGKANAYWPLGARGTLILRGELGAVNADSRLGIPDDYLFRAGGSQSVRGYAYGELGVGQDGAIVPGRYIGVVSIEVAHPVTEQWSAAVFYDAGNVADRWQDFSAVKGYGVGVRWKSPLGPLNVDLAYGEESRDVHLHFSVGVTF